MDRKHGNHGTSAERGELQALAEQALARLEAREAAQVRLRFPYDSPTLRPDLINMQLRALFAQAARYRGREQMTPVSD